MGEKQAVVTVFVNGKKVFKNVRAGVEDDQLVILNRVTDDELGRFTIVEVAKEHTTGMVAAAYDVENPTGERVRIAVQEGCGCGGMRQYQNDEGYSGALRQK
jgi:hypothetical protein